MAEVILAGKDYLTEPEAAAYACVSPSQLRAKAVQYGIQPFTWMGRTVYSKDQIKRAMDDQWRQSTSGGGRGISTGPKAVASTGGHSALSRVPRPSGPRK